jgi:hypothetical protein
MAHRRHSGGLGEWPSRWEQKRWGDDEDRRKLPHRDFREGVRKPLFAASRYYVSHAILQNRKTEAGSVARVPATEIETLVCDGVRRHLAAMGGTEVATPLAEFSKSNRPPEPDESVRALSNLSWSKTFSSMVWSTRDAAGAPEMDESGTPSLIGGRAAPLAGCRDALRPAFRSCIILP